MRSNSMQKDCDRFLALFLNCTEELKTKFDGLEAKPQ